MGVVVRNDLSLRDWMSKEGVSKWIGALSVTDAPVRRQGIEASLRFFQKHMPRLPASMALNFLAAMDLSRRVGEASLGKNDKVIAFRSRSEAEFKLFYTRSGASKHNSGINPHGRVAVQYVVHQPTTALESYTSGAIDVWSIPADYQRSAIAPRAGTYGVMVFGGGTQLIIPNAARNLTLTRVAD